MSFPENITAHQNEAPFPCGACSGPVCFLQLSHLPSGPAVCVSEALAGADKHHLPRL